ncbi:MAG: hypothetical protein ACI89L_002117 [Phycisphaerales bacterium]|jgi:hypothetical protein
MPVSTRVVAAVLGVLIEHLHAAQVEADRLRVAAAEDGVGVLIQD